MLRSIRASIPAAAASGYPARRCLAVAAARSRSNTSNSRATRRCVSSPPQSPPPPIVSCHARTDDGGGEPSATSSPPSPSPSPSSSSSVDLFGSLVSLALWAALLFYALNLSPNQTPARDLYLLQKLIPGTGAVDDGVAVNSVFYALFNAMGVMPALYAAVLIPAGRSGGGAGRGGGFPPRLPAWPFVAGSFALGFFALGPYLALWTPSPPPASEEERGGPRDATAPPPGETFEKSGAAGGFFLRAIESPAAAAVLLVAAAAQAIIAATAGGQAWVEFSRLFDESRLVHVTTLDFCALSAFIPFWVSNDAAARKFGNGSENGATLAAAMAAVPLVGPALYLVLRPKAKGKEAE